MVSSGWSSPRSQLLLLVGLGFLRRFCREFALLKRIAINQQLPARFAVLVYLLTLEFVSFWAYHRKFTSRLVDNPEVYKYPC